MLKKILEVSLGVSIHEINRENVERNTGNLSVRRKRQDILLKTNKGLIDIEMNACVKDYLHARNMAYLCDNYAHCTLVGEEYTEEVQIIQINFTYGLGKKDDKIVRKYYNQDEEQKKFVKNFVIYEYNMDKIMEFWYSKDKEKIEEYKYFIMLDLQPEELKELSKEDKIVEEYKMDVEIINRDVRLREYISEEEDRRKCFNSEISLARKEANIETAKKMLIDEQDIEVIVKYTSLSLEEIQKLKEEMSL